MHTAALRRKRLHDLIFDETLGTFLHGAQFLGMDLQPFVDSGIIRLEQIDPAEIAPGRDGSIESAQRLKRQYPPCRNRQHNGYLNAMPAERYLNLQLHELLSYLNQQGSLV